MLSVIVLGFDGFLNKKRNNNKHELVNILYER